MKGTGILLLLPLLFITLGVQAHSEKNDPKLIIPVEASSIPIESSHNESAPSDLNSNPQKATPIKNTSEADTTLISAISFNKNFVVSEMPTKRCQILSIRLTPMEIPDTGCIDSFILFPNESIELEKKAAQSDSIESMILAASENLFLEVNKNNDPIVVKNNKSYKIEYNYYVEGGTIVLDVFQSPVN